MILKVTEQNGITIVEFVDVTRFTLASAALANATDELCANVQTKVILSTFSHNLTDDTSLFKVFVLDFINEDVELRQSFLCHLSMLLRLEKRRK